MRYVTLGEILDLYLKVMAQSGGKAGVRNVSILESCLAQPRMTFEGRDLYESLPEKAAALCHSLIANHPFIDGNKRIGQTAAETFLLLNGYELSASIDEQESVIIRVASGQVPRRDLAVWFSAHTIRAKDIK
jgi:death on curing protein